MLIQYDLFILVKCCPGLMLTITKFCIDTVTGRETKMPTKISMKFMIMEY